MDPFRRLGLDRQADEREVRRAYARCLKTTRPDDDPDAFQALNEAYREALEWIRWREEDSDDADVDGPDEVALVEDVGTAPASQAMPGSGPSVLDAPDEDHLGGAWRGDAPADAEAPAFAVDPFLDAFFHQLRSLNAAALGAWLAAQDALYDLELKREVAHLVADALWDPDCPVIPSGEQLGAIEDFFGVEFGDHFRGVLRARHAVRSDDTRAYDEFGPLAIGQLKRPFRLAQAMWVSSMPGVPGRIALLARRLEEDAGELPPGIQPRQAEFFEALTGDRVGPDLLACIAARSVAWSVLATTVAALVLSRELGPVGLAVVFAVGVAVVALGHGAWVARLRLDAIAHRPDRSAFALPGIALVLAGVATASALAGAHPAVPWAAGVVALPFALRHVAQSFDLFRFCIGGYFIGGMLEGPERFALALGVGMLLFVACDVAFALRHRLPYAASRGNAWTTRASFVVFVGALLLRAGDWS